MAEAIKSEFGVDSEMIEGAGGIFDVHVDGKQIWCKKDIGRFPEHDEVIAKIKETASV